MQCRAPGMALEDVQGRRLEGKDGASSGRQQVARCREGPVPQTSRHRPALPHPAESQFGISHHMLSR